MDLMSSEFSTYPPVQDSAEGDISGLDVCLSS